MKFVHDEQPVGKRILQRATAKDPNIALCPCCKTAVEDQNHLLQCTLNPDRASLLQAFVKTLHALENHALYYLITQGIVNWMTNSTISFFPELRGYPVHMHEAIQTALDDQATIGWGVSLKGLFSKSWATVGSLSMYHPTDFSSGQGTNRLRHVLCEVYVLTNALWKARNAVLHDKSQHIKQQRLTSEQVEIQHYYNNRHLLMSADQHYCDRPLSSILLSTQSVRRRWLRQVHRSRASRLQDNLRQSTVTQFFPRTAVEPDSPLEPVEPEPPWEPILARPDPFLPPVPVPILRRQTSMLQFFPRKT